MAGTGQFGYFHHYLYDGGLADQHWKHRGVQCFAQSVHCGSDGYIRHLNRLCDSEKIQSHDSSSPIALVTRPGGLACQHHRLDIRGMVILLEFLA